MKGYASVNTANPKSEYYTPSDKVEPARIVMGSIDLDPASCPLANATAKATAYFTRETNGFHRDWWGNVWCNPPYSDYPGQAADWCAKMLQEYKAQRVTQGVLLVNLDQFGQNKIQDTAKEGLVCIHQGRIRFMNADGVIEKSPRYQNLFIYLGHNRDGFYQEFSKLGIVMGVAL